MSVRSPRALDVVGPLGARSAICVRECAVLRISGRDRDDAGLDPNRRLRRMREKIFIVPHRS